MKIPTNKIILVLGVLGALLVVSSSNGVLTIDGQNTTGQAGQERTGGRNNEGQNPFSQSQEALLNQAASGVFLNKNNGANQEQSKQIIDYLVAANKAIPLHPDALRFAMGQYFLGNPDQLHNAHAILQKSRELLEGIEPPPQALVFHTLSIELLAQYATILETTLATPTETFGPEIFGDVFSVTARKVDHAQTEAQFLATQFNFPYAPPRVIQLYDDALGR